MEINIIIGITYAWLVSKPSRLVTPISHYSFGLDWAFPRLRDRPPSNVFLPAYRLFSLLLNQLI